MDKRELEMWVGDGERLSDATKIDNHAGLCAVILREILCRW